MIQLKDIEKSVKSKAGELFILRQISLEINEGDFITFMGPSGAGKSTLLNCMATLYLANQNDHDHGPLFDVAPGAF